MSLEVAVHKALHDALASGSEAELSAFIAGRVFDYVPADPSSLPMPYIAIGGIDVIDDSTECSAASQVDCTLHVWSEARGSIEAKRIGGLVRTTLDRQLNFAGYFTCVWEFVSSIYRPSQDHLLTEGLISFRYQVDPLEETT